MKELFVAYTRYNRKANAAVISYLKGMSADQLRSPIKAFYPTIVDTVFHVMKSDVKWLERLGSFRKSDIGKEVLDKFMADGKVDSSLVAKYLLDFTELRGRIDSEMVQVVAAIPAEAFTENFEIEFGPKRIERPLWQLLMQWFNHHTHHRGQVSVQLDAVSIDNDYSGVLDKID